MDRSNTWLDERGARQIDLYVRSADAILPARDTIIQILVDVFRYHFGDRSGLSVLDLGCGDGIVTERMWMAHPANTHWLMDGSSTMLEKAKQRLVGKSVSFLHQSFESYIDVAAEDAKYDCVFSVNAIHHLDYIDKKRLFAKLYRELKHGGLFLNSDPVLPVSGSSEEWQFSMWRDWIAGQVVRDGRTAEHVEDDDLPTLYKQKPENKPSTLFAQLQALEQIGFRDVDCLFKYGIFAVFGATK
jgi:tRNA (cmo5U34)-methyltransferase